MKIYYIMMLVSVYAFMILLMYFLAGINKISSFNSTVEGFKHVLPMKGLPQIFYTLAIAVVIILEICQIMKMTGIGMKYGMQCFINF